MNALLNFAAILSVSVAMGQDAGEPKQEPKKDFNPAAVGSLVLAPLATDLKLSAEQKKNVDELEQEFHKKRKGALTVTMMKINSLMDKIEREQEPNPVLAVTVLMTTTLLDVANTKSAYEKKVSDLLSAEQQRKFETWQKLKPRDKKEPEPEELLEMLLQECGISPQPALEFRRAVRGESGLPTRRLQ